MPSAGSSWLPDWRLPASTVLRFERQRVSLPVGVCMETITRIPRLRLADERDQQRLHRVGDARPDIGGDDNQQRHRLAGARDILLAGTTAGGGDELLPPRRLGIDGGNRRADARVMPVGHPIFVDVVDHD